MKAPKCRLCGELHWGGCATQVAAQPAPTDKPARKGVAVKALASTAPGGDGAALTSVAHQPTPTASPKARKAAKAKKGKTKPKEKAATEMPALPAQRRPRGRPLQAEEKKSYENTKPWKKLKISRRTFYRRLKVASS